MYVSDQFVHDSSTYHVCCVCVRVYLIGTSYSVANCVHEQAVLEREVSEATTRLSAFLLADRLKQRAQRGYISKPSSRMVGWGWRVISFLERSHVTLNQEV